MAKKLDHIIGVDAGPGAVLLSELRRVNRLALV